MGFTRFAIENEPLPSELRPKVAFGGHASYLVDDIDRKIVIIHVDGGMTEESFPDSHVAFEPTDGPPSLWALYRQKKELIEHYFGEFMKKR